MKLWLKALLAFFKTLETIVPAAMVAWNAYLRRKRDALQARVDYHEHKDAMDQDRERFEKENANANPRAVIRRFFRRRARQRRKSQFDSD